MYDSLFYIMHCPGRTTGSIAGLVPSHIVFVSESVHLLLMDPNLQPSAASLRGPSFPALASRGTLSPSWPDGLLARRVPARARCGQTMQGTARRGRRRGHCQQWLRGAGCELLHFRSVQSSASQEQLYCG